MTLGPGAGSVGPKSFAGFQILEILGQGATATVYRARRGAGPEVALKVLSLELDDPALVKRFQREIAAMARLSHPRILRLVDHGMEGEDLWYAAEYSERRSLDQMLEERAASGSSFSLEEAFRLGMGLAEALEYLHHEGMVHRDLKPGNILVDEHLDPILMDFGLVRDFDLSVMTTDGAALGTPRFMSPEQVRGERAGRPSDVYSVGLILYRVVTGVIPLEGRSAFETAMRRLQEPIPPPGSRRPGLPPDLETILMRSLRADPEERYQDMGEFRRDFERLDLPGIGPRPGGRSPPASFDPAMRPRPVRPWTPAESDPTRVPGSASRFPVLPILLVTLFLFLGAWILRRWSQQIEGQAAGSSPRVLTPR